METPYVVLRCAGRAVTLGPGGRVGRLDRAELRLDDPRVSELHAYVSVRGGRLVLLALRGALTVDGIAVSEVLLERGVVVGLCPGLQLEVAEVMLGEVGDSAASTAPTVGRAGEQPLRLTLRYDSASIAPVVGSPLMVAGLSARLLSELALCGGAARWEVLAAELWPEEQDFGLLRPRWDKQLAALRRKLREAGLRDDLIQSVGGQVQLALLPHDSLDCEA